MRKLIFIIGFLFAILPLQAKDLYIAQAATSAANGSSCSNAYAYTFFNMSGNWGAGAGQIGPGTTVYLCGTVTSELIFQGSGAPGKNVVLKFENGTIMTSPAWNPDAININGQSYITIDGGTRCGSGTTCSANLTGTGRIQNTANGSSLANQVPSNLISGGSSCGHDIEVGNLLLLNAYTRTVRTDESSGAGNSAGVALVNCGSNLYVHDLTSTWAHTNILVSANSSVSNWDISNNATAHSTWGIATSMGGNSQIGSDIKIYGNDVNNGPDWDDPTDLFHRDGIFVYGHSSTGYFNGLYVYNNYLHGDWGNAATLTAFVYINQNLQNVYFFNNVLQSSANSPSNGLFASGWGDSSQFFYNNTFISYGKGGGMGMYGGGTDPANSTIIENNITYDVPSPINLYQNGANSIVAVDYNDYYGWDNTGKGPWNIGLEYDNFAGWQASACGSGRCDPHGSIGNPKLNPNATLQSGSAAIGLGKNLYSVCNGQPNPGLGALCYDKAGIARPSIGAWDAGAYSYNGTKSAAVQAPTGLTVIVK